MSDDLTGKERQFDRGFDGHRRRQARLGLALSTAERLRWLEQTLEHMRKWVGRIPRRERK